MSRIILIPTLTDFLTEAPPRRIARLSLTTDGGLSRLDLQALTRAGLIWLSDEYDRSAPPAVHQQLPAARDAVAGWLAWQGYEVRPGRWATPGYVKPEAGRFEVFRWEEAAGGWQLGVG